jgi:hypothetical protein
MNGITRLRLITCGLQKGQELSAGHVVFAKREGGDRDFICGPSLSKRPVSLIGLPIMKVPAGTPTISGQSEHS